MICGATGGREEGAQRTREPQTETAPTTMNDKAFFNPLCAAVHLPAAAVRARPKRRSVAAQGGLGRKRTPPSAMQLFVLLCLTAAAVPAIAATCAESPPLPTGIARLSLNRAHQPILREGDGRTWRLQPLGKQMMLDPIEPPASPPLPSADALPDGETAVGGHDIRRAWFAGATDRYPHGALGDNMEATELRVQTPDGRNLSLTLGEDSVFEDRYPRLVDLDGDGHDEIVVVRTYLTRGSALAIYGLRDGRLVELAETAPTGTPHEWLDPAGFPDLDGDGHPDIAVVQTPDSGGTLKAYSFDGQALHLLGTLAGFSNHVFGSPEMRMSAVISFAGERRQGLILPTDGRRIVDEVWWDHGKLYSRRFARHADPVSTAMLAGDFEGDGRTQVLYGLADGRLVFCSP